MKYEIRLNGIGDSKARVVKAISEKKAIAQVKKMLGIPVEQPCYYMCRKLKNKKNF